MYDSFNLELLELLMAADENHDKLIELFSCKLNSLNPHIYKIDETRENKKEYPKFLPCGNTVCDTCIKDLIRQNENKSTMKTLGEENMDEDFFINCPLCMNKHSLVSVKMTSLIPNKSLEDALELYREQIANYLLKKLNFQLNELHEMKLKYANHLNHFEKLDARFNNLSSDLKTSQIKIFEEALKKIRISKSSMNNFKVSKSVPEKRNIGKISYLNSTNLLENSGGLYKLKNFVLPDDLTIIDDFVIITASNYAIIAKNKVEKRFVIIVDEKFSVKIKYDGINSTLFERSEIKLISDLNENLFLSVKDLNEVFICDINDLSKMKSKIGADSSSQGGIIDLIDMFVYDQLVYILDSTKCLKVYNFEGAYLKSIFLYVPNLKSEYYDIIDIKNPREFNIVNNLAVVLSNNEIFYAFDLNGGEYIQSIDSRDCFMSVYGDRYLAVLNTITNKLFLYEKSDNNNLIESISMNINLYNIRNILRIKCFKDRLFIIDQNEIVSF